MSQQTGKYIMAKCIDCGEEFPTAHRNKPPARCPKCRNADDRKLYYRENARIQQRAKREKAEMLNRLKKLDAAAKAVVTTVKTLPGRIIERRGQVPIAAWVNR